jgi:4-diphosphocytidyl-2-C-methyl-D-erythritol kinase
MIRFPTAKINIGLYITSKRSDGFHEIETIMHPIPQLHDALEFMESKELKLQVSGAIFDADMYKNLVVQAHQLLQKKYNIPNITIYLHKGIPHGAGLGGGSSDAAYMLQMLNSFYNLDMAISELEAYASELGSDCAFFINNKAALATGRGEVVQAVSLDLSAYKIALIKPNVSINTAAAYAQCKPMQREISLLDQIKMPINEWRKHITNDFENLSEETKIVIESIKTGLYNAGALFAAMSGSGTTVYGIFEEQIPLKVDKGSTLFWSDL